MIEIGKYYTITELVSKVKAGEKAILLSTAEDLIIKNHQFLLNFILKSTAPIYGVNTGFGSLCNTKISDNELQILQENLLKSHACGVGDFINNDLVALMIILKAQSLAKGFSGVSVETVSFLLALYNHQIYPLVHEQGSLGASGDLAPLANLCLPMIGEGKVSFKGKVLASKEALNIAKISPLKLNVKEGLALINGTQFMQSLGIYAINTFRNLINQANAIATMSLEAFDCSISPFLPQTHGIRPHLGQIAVAACIKDFLKDSKIVVLENNNVQDPYSFRCIPQVHGASLDALRHIDQIFEVEINSVTDNPNVFEDDNIILSAGNFHGQTLALQLDFLAIAASEIASISERRIYKLISGERGLPAYLTPNPGLQSGFMIAQYVAAALVSQNKQLSTPASVDSIVSSNGQEDHVSMGANAATKALRILKNVENVLVIELLVANQSLYFKNMEKLSKHTSTIMAKLNVPFISEDIVLSELISKIELNEIV